METGLDEDKLKEHGFSSYLNYTMGYKDDLSAIGWGGRVQNKKDDPGMSLKKKKPE